MSNKLEQPEEKQQGMQISMEEYAHLLGQYEQQRNMALNASALASARYDALLGMHNEVVKKLTAEIESLKKPKGKKS